MCGVVAMVIEEVKGNRDYLIRDRVSTSWGGGWGVSPGVGGGGYLLLAEQ